MKQFNLLSRLLLLAAMLCFIPTGIDAQVTIGSERTPSSFSLLDLDTQPDLPGVGEKKGLHLPRLLQEMGQEERDALVSPASSDADKLQAEGVLIFNITTNCPEYWSGTQWVSLCGDCCDDTADATTFIIHQTF